jgi:hypothetical protein
MFKFYEISSSIESKAILAHSQEEAEEYLRTIMRNGIYKIEDLNIVHSYVLGTPTNYNTQSIDGQGYPEVIGWKDKDSDTQGVVCDWTELPPRIKKRTIKQLSVRV